MAWGCPRRSASSSPTRPPVRRGNTADPAGVSPPIRLRLSRDVTIGRLDKAAAAISRALEHDDDPAIVMASFAAVYWDYVKDPAA